MSFSLILSSAQGLFNLPEGGGAWDAFAKGWMSFADWRELVPLIVNVPLAILLVLPVAMWRRRAKRVYGVARVEESRAVIIYAGVSAAIAVMVLEHPTMALVVFGMGGLLRFRTPTGSGIGTGRAVYAVVLGLACGLGMFALALIMAIMGTLGVRLFSHEQALELTVKKIDPERFEASRAAYERLLADTGCVVTGMKPSPAKDQFSMVVMVPRAESPESVADRVSREIPEDLRGKVSFDTGE